MALALAVLLSHLPTATYRFLEGGLAVQCFFIISGFYMALVLSNKYHSTRLFYTNRALRLFPSYYVTVALSAAMLFGAGVSYTASPQLIASTYAHVGPALLLGFQTATLIGQDVLVWFKIGPGAAFVFDPANAQGIPETGATWELLLVPQAWSLSMEIVFYALVPWLAHLHSRTLVALAVASFGLRLIGHWMPVDYGLWQRYLFPTNLFLFILGMVGFRWLPYVARFPRVVGWGACIFNLALIVTLPLFGPISEVRRWFVYAAVAVFVPAIFNTSKGLAIDRWIGDLSYPIYLSHLLVVGCVLAYSPPMPTWVALAGTLVLSILLLILVDRPVDRWRQARASSGPPVVSLY